MTKPSAVSHTPGPWTAVDETSQFFARVYAGDDAPVDHMASPCGPDSETRNANARLIAAAPELLALVRRIAAQDEFTGATPNDLPMWQAYALLNAWRLEAIALLAKAEGR